MKKMTLGSLFDGSGTCPLAATLCGIEPVWASEIEEYPRRVTEKNFPNMIQYGDITKINGSEIEPVDIITGGSPCQDLSVAGNRKGLDGEKSGLFYEMIRVIKEMRDTTDGKYPRFVLWENVAGSFTSQSGHDFLAVLQNFAQIADPFAYVPEPECRQGRLKWKYSGSMVGDGYSISWRTFDSQFWGVPQRRRRVLVVVDLNGGGADKVLFERPGVYGYPPEGWRKEQAAPETTGGCAEDAVPLNFNPSDSRLKRERERESSRRSRPEWEPVATTGHFCSSGSDLLRQGSIQSGKECEVCSAISYRRDDIHPYGTGARRSMHEEVIACYDRQSYCEFIENNVCRTLAVKAHVTATGGDEALIIQMRKKWSYDV